MEQCLMRRQRHSQYYKPDISYLRQTIEELKNQISKYTQKTYAIDRDISAFKYKLAELEEKLRNMSTEISSLVEAHRKSEAKVTETAIKIENVLLDIKRLTDSIKEITDVVIELEKRVGDLSPAKQHELEKKIELLSTTLQEVQIKLNWLDTTYADLKRKLESIDDKIDKVVDTARAAQIISSDVKEYFEKLYDRTNGKKKTYVDSIIDDLSKVENLIKDIYERQNKLAQELVELRTKSEIAQDRVMEVLKWALIIAGIVSGLIGGLVIAFDKLAK